MLYIFDFSYSEWGLEVVRISKYFEICKVVIDVDSVGERKKIIVFYYRVSFIFLFFISELSVNK